VEGFPVLVDRRGRASPDVDVQIARRSGRRGRRRRLHTELGGTGQ